MKTHPENATLPERYELGGGEGRITVRLQIDSPRSPVRATGGVFYSSWVEPTSLVRGEMTPY